LTVGAIWLTIRGVRLSTSAVGLAVLLQVAIMLGVCVTVLIDQRAHLSAIPFSWAHLTGGLSGLSAGFPLALYMFIGWENGPALAEECRDPRRTVPRALYMSIAIGAALFVFFAYATVSGFNYDVSSIGRSSVPFLTVADHYLGGAAVLAWVAGTVSVLATLIAAVNSQARMLFDGGRSGLLPARLGHVRAPLDTPVNALLTMASVGLGIIGVWWVSHLIGLDTGSMNPVGLYAECSTMGTIVILFVYFLTALALPVFMWRRHRQSFSALRHVAIPVLGALTLIVPFVELCKPGQPAPYSEFPYIALAIVAAASVIAVVVVHRHPSTGSGEGTTFES
jgi:amino acid transporter